MDGHTDEAADKVESEVRANLPPKDEEDPVTRATREAFERTGAVLLGLREFRYALKNSPKYDESKSTVSFKRHLREVADHAVIYGVIGDVQRKFLLYKSLAGQSAERAEHLGPNSNVYQENPRYGDFEKLILEVFHPQSERNLAKSEFVARKQAADEDVSSYFSAKLALFRAAAGEDFERDFYLLKEEMVAGLYSGPIKRAVWSRDPETIPALQAAILKEVGLQRIAFNRGFGAVTNLDGLQSVSGVREALRLKRQQRQDQVEPMEIGQVGGTNRDSRRKFTGKCFHCQEEGHLKRDCPRQRKQSGDAKERRCYWCTSTRHLANNCPIRRSGKPKVKIGAVEEEEVDLEEMTEEELEQYVEHLEDRQNGSVNMIGGAIGRSGRARSSGFRTRARW